MTTSGWDLVGSGIAVFLIGANIALLGEFGHRLVSWFQAKLAAVVVLLGYVALSFLFGSPSMWRVAVGIGALLLDALAMGWMWMSLSRLNGGHPSGHAPQVVKPDS